MKNKKAFDIAAFGILLAIEILFCFTVLGSLPAIGPIVATFMMIPVVITAILLGPGAGTLMGFFAGLFSFIVWTFMPPNPLIAFLFTPFYSLGEFQGNFGSVLICFVPRILGGTFGGFAYKLFKDRDALAFPVSAVVGSLTNTIGVMGGIWLFFGTQYESIFGGAMLAAIGSTVLFSGVPEAIIAALVAYAVCTPVKKMIAKI